MNNFPWLTSRSAHWTFRIHLQWVYDTLPTKNMSAFRATLLFYLIIAYSTQFWSLVLALFYLPLTLFWLLCLFWLCFNPLCFKKSDFLPQVEEKVHKLNYEHRQQQQSLKFVWDFGLTLIEKSVNVSKTKLDVYEIRRLCDIQHEEHHQQPLEIWQNLWTVTDAFQQGFYWGFCHILVNFVLNFQQKMSQ